MFITIALTGVRPGELLALSLDSLDFARHELVLNQANDRGKIITLKSNKSYRRVPMPAILENELRQWVKSGYTSNAARLLFVSTVGTPLRLSKVNDKQLHPILKRLGIALRGLHAFRHTTASTMFSLGASPKVVQTQLGHEDPETTLGIYGHLIGDEHRQAAERMARVLFPKVTRAEGKALVVN